MQRDDFAAGPAAPTLRENGAVALRRLALEADDASLEPFGLGGARSRQYAWTQPRSALTFKPRSEPRGTPALRHDEGPQS